MNHLFGARCLLCLMAVACRGEAKRTNAAKNDSFESVVVERRLVYHKECAMNSACAADGLMGNCCPDDAGDFLSCCPTAMCASYPACGTLEGSCCPSEEGKMLDCCFADDPTPSPTMAPTDKPSFSPANDAQCSSYELCASLTGNCCPTVDNVMLNCCDGIVEEGEDPFAPEDDDKSGVEEGSTSSEEPSQSPTDMGVEGGGDMPSDAPTPEPTPPPTESGNEDGGSGGSGGGEDDNGDPPAACSAYPACVDDAGEPFVGDCCPFQGNHYHGCCSRGEPRSDQLFTSASQQEVANGESAAVTVSSWNGHLALAVGMLLLARN